MYAGQWQYFQAEVTTDMEAYFLGAGEAPGRWVGAGAADLGLGGVVEDGQLARLFDQGCHPVTGVPLGVPYPTNTNRARVTGYSLTFSAPKTVSVLWALGGEQVRDQVRAAHDAAVDA